MKKLRFAVSLITQDNDYQLEQAAAAEEVARRLGADIQILFADNDSVRQSQQVLELVQSSSARPDGILVESVSGTALPQVARAAVSAGTAWVVLNREAEYIAPLREGSKVPVFALATDNEEAGRIEGRQMAALLPSGGNLLYIQGPSDSAAARLRTEGMAKTKPSSIQIKSVRAHWTEASAYKAISAWLRLTTFQQAAIDLIVAQNDAMAMGARKAFQELPDGGARERWLSLPYTGCDGLPKTGQAWVRSGTLVATIITPPLAGQAVEMLTTALRTNAIQPALTFVPPRSFPAIEELSAARATGGNAATAGKA
jgi:ABC-type sugar transport system substrate-binding protein